MQEIVERLTEKRQIERAKKILESEGYNVSRMNESISEDEKKTILSMFKSSNQDVIESREESEDGAKVFVVECDNSNPTYIADLQDKLASLEDKGIGYDREGNGNGFYGRNYIFYKYEDFDESKKVDELEESKGSGSIKWEWFEDQYMAPAHWEGEAPGYVFNIYPPGDTDYEGYGAEVLDNEEYDIVANNDFPTRKAAIEWIEKNYL